MFAQAFTLYFQVVTDYGFNLSAPRAIAIQRSDTNKLSEIFNSIFFIKIFLSVAGFLVFLMIAFSFEKLRGELLLYTFSFGSVIGSVLLPVWFFQGMEKMKYITVLNLLSKIIYTVSLFVFIRHADDYIFIPLLNAAGMVIAGIIALYIIRKTFRIRFFVPVLSVMRIYLKESTEYFLSRIFVTIYTNSNTFIIGLSLGNVAAGYYAAAEKLFNAFTAFYTPLNDSLFPYMSGKKDVSLFKKIFKVAFGFNTVLCIAIIFFSDNIIHLMYGAGYLPAVGLLKIFGLLGFFMVPAILLGYPFLAAMGHPVYANRSVIVASIAHLVLLLLLLPFLSIYLVGWLLIVTQLVVLGIRVYGVYKHKLFAKIIPQ